MESVVEHLVNGTPLPSARPEDAPALVVERVPA